MGYPSPPPTPSPLPVVPPPDRRDLELAYVRGHVAGLDRRSENPAPPQGAAQQAPKAAGHDPIADTVSRTALAPQAAPLPAAEPREDHRPVVPAEAPRRPPEPAHRRSPSPQRGHGGRHRGWDYNSPGGDDRAAYRRSYRTPERYDKPQSERRVSGGPAPATRGSDCAVARHDNGARRGTPDAAPESRAHGQRDDADQRRRPSPSPESARRLRYDAPETRRRPDYEPRTAPHTRPPHDAG